MKLTLTSLCCLVIMVFMSCKDSPKVIKSVNNSSQNATVPIQSTGIFSENESSTQPETNVPPTTSEGMHTVKAVDVLQATRYVYVKVEEDGSEYWIATTKQEVDEGETYFYRGGLLKTNFESKEHNRIFDQIYLVSRIVPVNHANSVTSPNTNTTEDPIKSEMLTAGEVIKVSGSIPISDIIKAPKSYEGKEVQISGRCIKVNPNIMGRNWIHLQDGTQGDFDMVATTSIIIPEGQLVTIKGTINLDVDFGAGYLYDIIMEDAVILKMQ